MTRELNLLGDINPEVVNNLHNALTSIPPDTDKLVLNIGSGGGMVTSAVIAYNLLKKLPFPLETHNLGDVSSAAILLYLAGSIRTAEPVFKFMFHPFVIGADNSMSVSSVTEKMKILEADLENYAKIVKKEAPAFAKEYDVIDILKHQTVIITEPSEGLRLGILTPTPVRITSAGEATI